MGLEKSPIARKVIELKSKEPVNIISSLILVMGINLSFDQVYKKFTKLKSPGIPYIKPLLDYLEEETKEAFSKRSTARSVTRKGKTILEALDKWFQYRTPYAHKTNNTIQQTIIYSVRAHEEQPISKNFKAQYNTNYKEILSETNQQTSPSSLSYNEVYSFELIPSEMIVQIILYLNRNDIFSLMITSKTIFGLLDNNNLWLIYLKMKFPNSVHKYKEDTPQWAEITIWKEHYLHFKRLEMMLPLLDSLDAQELKDWDSHSNINETNLKWITFNKIVCHITTSSSQPFKDTIILAHYNFCDDDILFETFKRQYHAVLKNHHAGGLDQYDCRLMITRILNFMKNWMESISWKPLSLLEQKTKLFLESESENLPYGHIVKLVKKRIEDTEQTRTELLTSRMVPGRRQSISSLQDLDSRDIAEQLCLIESEYWLNIKVGDFFAGAWKADKYGAKNIIAALEWEDYVIDWVSKNSVKQDMVHTFLVVAQKMFQYRNWQTTASILKGLEKGFKENVTSNLPIYLNNIYDLLISELAYKKSVDEQYENMKNKLDYRISNADPTISWIRLLIKRFDSLDKQFESIHPGNPVLINYEKCVQSYNLVSTFMLYQDVNYSFVINETIKHYLMSNIHGKYKSV